MEDYDSTERRSYGPTFLDPKPLVDYIDSQRGGLAAVLLAANIESHWVDRYGKEHPTNEYKKWQEFLTRNGKKGLRYDTVDTFCCDLLRVHPTAVYGPDWYAVPVAVDITLEVAA